MKTGHLGSFAAALVVMLGSTLAARGQDAFRVDAVGTSSSASVSGHNLIDLTKDIVNNNGQFASLAGQNFTASLNYAGQPNAIVFSQNAAGTSTTLTIPSTGFTKTFTGTDKADLQNQIEDFMKKDSADAIAAFTQQMNQLTAAGVTDGNPFSTTAYLARQSFNQFGFHQDPFGLGQEQNDKHYAGLRFDFDGGWISTDHLDGDYFELTITSSYHYTENVGLVVFVPLMYRELGNTWAFQTAFGLGLPITIIVPKGDKSFSWTVTPSGVVAGGGSVDLLSGGLLWSGQITSSLGYRLGKFDVVMANQYGYYNGFPITIDGYKFDTKVDQSIVRNGLQVTYNPSSKFFIDTSLAFTNFINKAGVSDYWTPSVGIGWRWGAQFQHGFRIGYMGDFGPGYESNGLTATLAFNF